MLRQGKAHERRDAEAKHLREHRDAEPDKARHIREQEQRDTLRQRKATPSGITVSGLGLSLLSRRAGGSTHYAIIHHSNLKVI